MKRYTIFFLILLTSVVLFLSKTQKTEQYSIDVNGTTQHLYVDSSSKENPLLLFLHWGPGLSEAPYKDLFSSKLNKHATIVHWDQRGAGKSFPNTNFESLTINTYVEDTLHVIRHLQKKFNKEKIVLVGHSWGALVGSKVAQQDPTLLHAFISISQIVNTLASEQLSYEFLLKQTKEHNLFELHQQLVAIGNPPYKKPEHWGLKRKVLHDFGGILFNKNNDEYSAFTQEHVNKFDYFSEDDKKNYMLGYQKSVQGLFGEILMTNTSKMTHYDIPIYFMLGEHDYTVVSEIGKSYFSDISAPKKQLFQFPNSAHCPHLEEPEKYQDTVISILKTI